MMTLYERIVAIYPDLTMNDFVRGAIQLQDNSDGRGVYIAVWEHPTHPKPTDEQLAAVQ